MSTSRTLALVAAGAFQLVAANAAFGGTSPPPGVPGGIDLSHLRLAPSAGFLVTEAALPLRSLEVAGVFAFDVAAGGLLVAVDPEGERLRLDPVRTRLGLQLGLALGLLEHAEIGVNALFIPFQSGSLELFGSAAGELPVFAFGDVRFHAKINPWPRPRGFTLALSGVLSAPSGRDRAFAGERAATFTPSLLADLRAGIVTVGLNAGYTVRSSAELAGLDLADELRFSAAVRVELVPDRFEVLADAYLKIGVGPGPLGAEEVPAEVLAAARIRIRSWAVTAGAGLGLGHGYGAPLVRFFIAGSRAPVEVVAARAPDVPAEVVPEGVEP